MSYLNSPHSNPPSDPLTMVTSKATRAAIQWLAVSGPKVRMNPRPPPEGTNNQVLATATFVPLP